MGETEKLAKEWKRKTFPDNIIVKVKRQTVRSPKTATRKKITIIITMEKEEKFIGIVQMSFHLLSIALEELLILNEEKRDPNEIHLMNLPPFKFYRISLQYMIIMELTKLLEKDTKDKKSFKSGTTWENYENTNSASLAKNSRLIYELKGHNFDNEHLENKVQLEKIWNSAFYEKLKNDRDKKFGHSDADYQGDVYSIKTYSESEIKEAKAILNQIQGILKRCTGAFKDYQFVSPQDNRTRNFIDYHIVYQEFYDKNLMKAVSERYTINHKRNGEMSIKK